METSKNPPVGHASNTAGPNDHEPGAAPRVQTEAHSVPLILLTVLAVVFILDWAQMVFIPLVMGVIVSYALAPLVTRLYRWHIPRVIGAAALLLLIVGGVGWMAYSLQDEAKGMIEVLPEAAQKLRKSVEKEWGSSKDTIEKVQQAAEQIEHVASDAAVVAPPKAPRGVTRVQIEEPKFSLQDYLWNGTLGALSLLSLAVMVLFLAYFLLISGDMFRRKLVKLSGPTLTKKKITVQMLDEINDHIQRYLVVQVFTSALVGIATWLAFLWIGMEHAAVWGVTAAVFNLIPYLGAVIFTGVTALMAFLQFGTASMALTVAMISLVINSLEGYLLTPWLTGRAGRMNGAVVFVGILFWGWLWGAWGLLLGLPIMMAVKSASDRIEDLKAVGEFMGD